MKKLLSLILSVVILSANAQTKLRDSVKVTNNVFSVIYSEKLEQPIWLKYRSTIQ